MSVAATSNVTAVNQLTARWCRSAGAGDFVLSGVGVWPLLGILADAAGGPARSELERAIRIPAGQAKAAALEVLAVLEDSAAVAAALGVWARADLPLRSEWVRGLPEGVVRQLGGQEVLDAWARERTGGMIEKFPLRLTAATVLVLATALFAETGWRTPFQPARLAIRSGPWAGRDDIALLRHSPDAHAVAILDAEAPVTRIVVEGDNDLDVHLLLGGAAGEVLSAGLGALGGSVPVRTDLPVGTEAPGLIVRTETGVDAQDQLRILMPPFDIRSTHDLLAQPEVFGLRAATTSELDNFPAISPIPLFLSQGKQDALAQFSARGFKAAAVTAFAVSPGGMPPPRTHETRLFDCVLDRPFGFLAVHRPTALALAAGWLATAPAAPAQPGADDTIYPPGAPRPVRHPII
ncbi:serpin family protein [Nocardia sp. NPDC048505]|uniref:serpin family protein n=1 Tax=unclassified Nocardia TaxID=2637762 RepID=UPI0033C92BC4